MWPHRKWAELLDGRDVLIFMKNAAELVREKGMSGHAVVAFCAAVATFPIYLLSHVIFGELPTSPIFWERSVGGAMRFSLATFNEMLLPAFAVVFAISALVRIHGSGGALRGAGLAWAAIPLGFMSWLAAAACNVVLY